MNVITVLKTTVYLLIFAHGCVKIYDRCMCHGTKKRRADKKSDDSKPSNYHGITTYSDKYAVAKEADVSYYWISRPVYSATDLPVYTIWDNSKFVDGRVVVDGQTVQPSCASSIGNTVETENS